HVVPTRDEFAGAGTMDPGIRDRAMDEAESSSSRMLERTVESLERQGVRASARMASGSEIRTLTQIAGEIDADLVIMGAQPHNALRRALFGSVSDGLRERLDASLLLARTPPSPERVLIAVDASKAARRGEELGVELAQAWGSESTVLHVLSTPIYGLDAHRDELAEAYGIPDYAHLRPPVRFELDVGEPHERILANAEQSNAGLVVMGSRLPGSQGRFGLGSVSAKVVHQCEASLLLVREAQPQA
ncbi:MAG: universal stress protein, partial [Candidatus Thermoplasmatota archaeon]|nr:universal stress protein [Candidatus Thermoplasmatota archaeon]